MDKYIIQCKLQNVNNLLRIPLQTIDGVIAILYTMKQSVEKNICAIAYENLYLPARKLTTNKHV